ncbi:DUF262 domain-containing protein [Mesorhizobium sp. B2-4-9]|nr:DUF262 domain-containing protein [Mesorhizobium sp. B2-5-2]TPL27871.1 DUF262 domain-containing protein [Mesorhizobium sp. B2-4-7]TPL31577.1 DUF262 domain-containing protein [Mesorhizobium sp. B2-4-9]TPL41700.1 DUF262 domain-containing protein [Mesorhizobium sp. B2-4-5]TPM77851.1 DUF262 domain-containing protein [Mesorhizobium sp. B2-1-6]TPN78109.1 DUF262 domain-containing protein [Mesorhizobium sp. B1-1-2]
MVGSAGSIDEDSDPLLEELDDTEEADSDFNVISFKTVDEIEKSIVDSPFRAIYQTNNFLLPQIKDVVDESKTVNLRPEYQRRSRWTNKQKSLLIESFLLNIPVPPIFLFEGDFARYEVMDGQQRLLAIREFFANQFKLSSLGVLAPLVGRTYASLPPRTKRTLERASLSAIVLLKESRASLRDANTNRVLELKKFVFERLNTGGKKLNAQEIRNAVYSGVFNDTIISLTRTPAFTRIWGIPPYSAEYTEADYESPERKKNALYQTMGDCQIVLRYFALQNDKGIKGSMRSILDKCMEANLDMTSAQGSIISKQFSERLTFADALFDGAPFRLSPGDTERRSESMYDAVMIAIDRLWARRNDLIAAKQAIQTAYWAALDSPEKIEQFTGRANTAADIRARITAMEELFKASVKNA